MARDLTKIDWKEVQTALLSVPLKHRNSGWKKLSALVEEVLKGPNSRSVQIDPVDLRYAPCCDLCHKPIELGHDFVFKAVTGTYRHYDCFHADFTVDEG